MKRNMEFYKMGRSENVVENPTYWCQSDLRLYSSGEGAEGKIRRYIQANYPSTRVQELCDQISAITSKGKEGVVFPKDYRKIE